MEGPVPTQSEAEAAAAEVAGRELVKLTLVLGACGFASTFSMRLLDPLVPTLAQEFGRPVQQIALMAAGFSFAYAVGQPFLGPVADSVGKMRTILTSLIALTVALLVGALTTSFEALFALRMVMGVFAGGIIPVAMAAIGDRAPMAVRQVALGRFLTVMIIGQMIGAASAGALSDLFGWRSVMIAGAMVAISAALLVWKLLPPRRNAQRVPLSVAGALARYKLVFDNPRSKFLLLIVITEGSLVFGLLPYVAEILRARTGAGATEAGLVVSGAGIGGLIYGFTVAAMVKRFGQRGMMQIGAVILGLAYLIFALPLPWWTGTAVFTVQGIGFFMLHGTFQTLATELAPEARGSAVSLFACALFFGHAIGPALVGLLLPVLGTFGTLAALAVGLTALGVTAPRVLKI